MQKKKRKSAVTLIEIMIVILIIGLIGGALAFNMRGSMDQGRAFKTEQNKTRIHDILMMEYAKGNDSLADVVADWANIVKASPFVNGNDIIKDGWKDPFIVELSDDGQDIDIRSDKYKTFKEKHDYKNKK